MWKIGKLLIQLTIICQVKIHSQTIIEDCNDPLVGAQHVANFGHSFCYHSCGYDLGTVPPVGMDTCTGGGNCLCNYACDTPPPAAFFGNQCPVRGADPATDSADETVCDVTCSGACAEGVGQICGEVYDGPIPPTTDMFAKVCTCYCPPQPCIPITTTTVAPITTTTSAPDPTSITILKVKVPILIKVVKLCIFVIKLYAHFWLKIILYCVYDNCFGIPERLIPWSWRKILYRIYQWWSDIRNMFIFPFL